MDVAVMYSGGKDSTLAIEHAMNKRWNIKYLLSVKPSRTDCYLFHFATVEQTQELARILGFKHFYTGCNVADPKMEARIVRGIVAKNVVDALVLGGTGLQKTQINTLRNELFGLGVEVFACHTGEDHGRLLLDMVNRGYDIRISQIAVEGLGREWLGRKIGREAFFELRERAERFGFHLGFEGGHADTLVVDGPIFNKRLEILDSDVVMENKFSGHLRIKETAVIDKRPMLKDLY